MYTTQSNVGKSEEMKLHYGKSLKLGIQSDLPTIFQQALSTPLAIVCPPRSVEIHKRISLKSCR